MLGGWCSPAAAAWQLGVDELKAPMSAASGQPVLAGQVQVVQVLSCQCGAQHAVTAGLAMPQRIILSDGSQMQWYA